MATSYCEVYNQFDVIHDKDKDRTRFMTPDMKYESYNKHLKASISLFLDECNKNLSRDNRNDMVYTTYYFYADGESNEFQLEPTPPYEDCLMYVGYRENDEYSYTEITDYEFDSETNILKLQAIPICGYEIYVSVYKIGEFNADLNEVEIDILAYGMLCSWDSEKIHKETLTNQAVYNSNVKAFSKSQHINSLLDMKNSTYYIDVIAKINKYSYRQSKNGLYNMSGRQYMYNPSWKENKEWW